MKICPQCRSEMLDSDTFCKQCGARLTEINVQDTLLQQETPQQSEEQHDTNPEQNTQQNIKYDSAPPKNTINWALIIRVALWVIAGIVVIICFDAAGSIAKGGEYISRIESVGGQTLDEAYYYDLGYVYSGYANMIRACGLFFAAVLSWLGYKSK